MLFGNVFSFKRYREIPVPVLFIFLEQVLDAFA